jgi:hypothetical protein
VDARSANLFGHREELGAVEKAIWTIEDRDEDRATRRMGADILSRNSR